MMRRLYQLLLRLYPARIRAEFAEEMLDLFDQLADDERRRGPAAYALFCAREAAGLVVNLLLRENLMKHKRPIVYGGLAGLLIGAALGAALAARPYTSTALLRTVPQQIPERFVPASNIAADRVLPDTVQVILSRGNLINVINTYNLYPRERTRMPMEDVVERMRQAIRIGPMQSDSMQVSFAYSDRILAQQITGNLAGRIIQEYVRNRRTQSLLTLQFMDDRARLAAADWDKRLDELRAAERAHQPVEHVRLDADIARQRYENLSAKAAEADMLKTLEDRQQGPALEMLDPPSLPAESRPPVFLVALLGAIIGALTGWLTSFVLSLRPHPAVAEAS